MKKKLRLPILQRANQSNFCGLGTHWVSVSKVSLAEFSLYEKISDSIVLTIANSQQMTCFSKENHLEVQLCPRCCLTTEEARPEQGSVGCQPPLLVWSQLGHHRQAHQRWEEGAGLCQDGIEDCLAVYGRRSGSVVWVPQTLFAGLCGWECEAGWEGVSWLV